VGAIITDMHRPTSVAMYTLLKSHFYCTVVSKLNQIFISSIMMRKHEVDALFSKR